MRNHGLDAAKAVAAYFVILLHIRFPGRTGEILNVLARFAVPFFLYGIGVFLLQQEWEYAEQNAGQDHARAVFDCGFLSVLFCLAVYAAYDRGEGCGGVGIRAFGTGAYFGFLKYNYSLVKYHLWFLPALLYCYLLFAAVEKLHLHKAAYLLIPVLLVLLFRMEAANITAKGTYRPRVYRNYLYTGFPFLCWGI